MYTDEIYSLAIEINGGESETLKALCSSMASYLSGRLKEQVSVDDCKEQFILAAASMASDMYASSEPESYRAGNVSVTAHSSGELTRQAKIMMLPFIKDDEFAFLGVEG